MGKWVISIRKTSLSENSSHKLGEQLAVEVVRLRAIRAREDSSEERYLLDNQVFI